MNSMTPPTIESQILICSWDEWLGCHKSFRWQRLRCIVQLTDEPKLLHHPQGDATVYGFFDGGEPLLMYDKAWYERKDVINGLLKRQWPLIEFVWEKE